ncbi:MAG: MBL fold metallo-hydrolase [Candidatus Brennerbacteria bacterium]
MVITYQGEGYVKVTAGSLSFLVDPTDERSFRGAKFVLITQNPSPLLKGKDTTSTLILREPLIINHPGEYEAESVRITAYQTGVKEDTALIAYRVLMEGITLGFLGHLSELPDQKSLGGFADLDILFVPGGGAPWLKESDAAKIVRQLEPGLVVPILLTKKTCEAFAKELGAKTPTSSEKLVIKKKDIVSKACTVVCLSV